MDDLRRDDLLVATPEMAARLGGVTVRQVDYWREIGLIEPAVARRISARNEVRLYDFTGLVELRIVAALADNDVAVTVRRVLLDAGHECWTAADANLHDAPDDAVAVYAVDRSAARSE